MIYPLDLMLNLKPSRKIAQPQIGQAPTPVPDPLVEKAYDLYLNMPMEYHILASKNFEYDYDSPIMNLDYTLTPCQIELLLSKIIATDRFSVPDSIDGLFLSIFIQKSYEVGGYSRFMLQTGAASLNFLGCNLKGSEDKRITLSIDGDVGRDCALDASYLDLEVAGNAGSNLGVRMSNSSAVIRGQNNHLDFMGDYATECEFYVVNDHTFSYLRTALGVSNKIFLIDDAGKIIDQRLDWCRK